MLHNLLLWDDSGTFAFTLAPLAARSGGTPCSTLSFCPVAVFESRKLVFLRWKWQVFMLLGLFWGVFGDFWARNRHLFSFFGVASLLREGVGVLGATTHLLNVTVQGTMHLVHRTLEPLVQCDFHWIRLTPNRFARIAVSKKHIAVMTAQMTSASQKFSPFAISQGITRNMGNVGITYQKV